jgi:lactoylglutathione lyase
MRMGDAARFHFTKILVNDPDALLSFYSAAFGMKEKYRVAQGEGGGALSEIIMTNAAGGDPTLVLLHYVNRPVPVPGETVIGYTVADLEATLHAVEAAGGTVEEPPKEMPEHGITVAFVLDPEGHRLELFQRL